MGQNRVTNGVQWSQMEGHRGEIAHNVAAIIPDKAGAAAFGDLIVTASREAVLPRVWKKYIIFSAKITVMSGKSIV